MQEKLAILKLAIQTPAFKREAAKIALVLISSIIGAVVATKIDSSPLVESIDSVSGYINPEVL